MKNLNEPRKGEEVVPFERKVPVERETKDSLIPTRQVEDLRQRWTTIQSHFVDEPRQSVEEADQLVQSAIKQIQDVLGAERSNLEKQWARGDQASTEDLRVCLQRYHQFFDRVLTKL